MSEERTEEIDQIYCLICEQVFATHQQLCDHMHAVHAITIVDETRYERTASLLNTDRSPSQITEPTQSTVRPVNHVPRASLKRARSVESDKGSVNTAGPHAAKGNDVAQARAPATQVWQKKKHALRSRKSSKLDNRSGHSEIAAKHRRDQMMKVVIARCVKNAKEKLKIIRAQGSSQEPSTSDPGSKRNLMATQSLLLNNSMNAAAVVESPAISSSVRGPTASSSTPIALPIDNNMAYLDTSHSYLTPGQITCPTSKGVDGDRAESPRSEEEIDHNIASEGDIHLQSDSSISFSCAACALIFDNYLDLNAHITETHDSDRSDEISQFRSIADDIIKDTELANEERPTLWDVRSSSVIHRLSPILELQESGASVQQLNASTQSAAAVEDLIGNGDVSHRSLQADHDVSVGDDHASHPPNAKRRRRDSGDSGISIGPLSSGGQPASNSSSTTPRQIVSPVPSSPGDSSSVGGDAPTDIATQFVISNVRSLSRSHDESEETADQTPEAPADSLKTDLSSYVTFHFLRYYIGMVHEIRDVELKHIAAVLHRPFKEIQSGYHTIKARCSTQNIMSKLSCCTRCGEYGFSKESARGHLFSRQHLHNVLVAIMEFHREKRYVEDTSTKTGSLSDSAQHHAVSGTHPGVSRVPWSMAVNHVGSVSTTKERPVLNHNARYGMDPVTLDTQMVSPTNTIPATQGLAYQPRLPYQNNAAVSAAMNPVQGAGVGMHFGKEPYITAHQQMVPSNMTNQGDGTTASQMQTFPGGPVPGMFPSSVGYPQQYIHPHNQQPQTLLHPPPPPPPQLQQNWLPPPHQQQQQQPQNYQHLPSPHQLGCLPPHQPLPSNGQVPGGSLQASVPSSGPRPASSSVTGNSSVSPVPGIDELDSSGLSRVHRNILNNLRTLRNPSNSFSPI